MAAIKYILTKKTVYLYNKLLSVSKTARKLGVDRNTVYYHLRKTNKKLYNRTKDYEERIKKLYEKGLSDNQIQKEEGISRSTIKLYREKHTLKSNVTTPLPAELVGKEKAKCRFCRKTKFLKLFRWDSKNKSYSSACRSCIYKRMRLKVNNNLKKFLNFQYRYLIHRCRYKKIVCSIKVHDLFEIYKKQNGKCFYTGEKLRLPNSRNKRLNSRNVISLDRIVPSEGYSKNNIVLCLRIINTVKNDLTVFELKKWIPAWYKKVVRLRKDLRKK